MQAKACNTIRRTFVRCSGSLRRGIYIVLQIGIDYITGIVLVDQAKTGICIHISIGCTQKLASRIQCCFGRKKLSKSTGYFLGFGLCLIDFITQAFNFSSSLFRAFAGTFKAFLCLLAAFSGFIQTGFNLVGCCTDVLHGFCRTVRGTQHFIDSGYEATRGQFDRCS